MKHLILVFLVTCQMVLSSVALAWSPMDGVEHAIDRMQNCLFTTASSEQSQEGEKKEGGQEEEPDCE